MWRHFNRTQWRTISALGTGTSSNKIRHRKSTPEELIRSETKISHHHLTPEIALHLITDECRLYHQRLDNGPSGDKALEAFGQEPYWAFYWPGGQALTKYLLENPELVAGKIVLDVGSGCGASSIAALKCNAKYAIANDIDRMAGFAARLNAKLNSINNSQLITCTEDLICAMSEKENSNDGRGVAQEERPEIEADVILIGDLFYDEGMARALRPWLKRLCERGKLVLIGDPGRHGLTPVFQAESLQLLVSYRLTDNCCLENNSFQVANVWKFSTISNEKCRSSQE